MRGFYPLLFIGGHNSQHFTQDIDREPVRGIVVAAEAHQHLLRETRYRQIAAPWAKISVLK